MEKTVIQKMRKWNRKKQTTANLKQTENGLGLIHGCRGFVYLVKWFMQGLNIYTQGVRSENQWTHEQSGTNGMYIDQSGMQPINESSKE